VIYAQTVYARTVDPGYKRDHILQVEELSRYQLIDKGEAIAEQVRRVPGVDRGRAHHIGVATDNNNNTGVMVPGSIQAGHDRQYTRSTKASRTPWAST
jgi:putative ABC transport system permease protein